MVKVAYLIVKNLRSTQELVALQSIVASQHLHVEIRYQRTLAFITNRQAISVKFLHDVHSFQRRTLPEVHSPRVAPRGSLTEFHSQSVMFSQVQGLGFRAQSKADICRRGGGGKEGRGREGGGEGWVRINHGAYVLSCMMHEYLGDRKQRTTSYPTSLFTQIIVR